MNASWRAHNVSRHAAALAAGFIGLALSAAADVHVTVSPATLPWMSNAWVSVAVSNLAAGSEIDLHLYVDVAGDGRLSDNDPLLAAFHIKDGVTNDLGSSAIVDDADGTANGTVLGRIAYSGDRLDRAVGNYLWVARTNGGAAAAGTFAITQPTGTVWITGSVIDYATSNAIAGAWVHLISPVNAITPATWTGTNGTFKLYLPPDVSTADVQTIEASGIGYFRPGADTLGSPVASYAVTADLMTGENPLPYPLRLVPEIPGQVYSIAGHVYDGQSNALPGVTVAALVQSEWGGFAPALTVSDSQGAYRLPVPAGAVQFLNANPFSLARIGRVSAAQSMTVTGAMTGVDVFCLQATVLARGKVLADDNSAPVLGVQVTLSTDAGGGIGVSMDDGTYEVGLLPGTNYVAGVSSPLPFWGFLPAPLMEGLSILDGPFTNAQFRLQRGYYVTGTVYDRQTNALSGGNVAASRYEDRNAFVGYVSVNRHGLYRLFAPTGMLAVSAVNFSGFSDQTYSNRSPAEQVGGIQVADPVLNTTNGVTGIDFHLTAPGTISGHIYEEDGVTPIGDCPVQVNDFASYRGVNNTQTEPDGSYSLSVPPGTYRVRAYPTENGLPYAGMFYSNTFFSSASLAVTVTDAGMAGSIDFRLPPAALISGHVLAGGDLTAVENCVVAAEDPATGEYLDTDRTDAAGNYTFLLAQGAYRIAACPSHTGLPYVNQYYSNAWSQTAASPVEVAGMDPIPDIDFVLDPGCAIAGYAFASDGVTPLPGIDVNAQGSTSNWWSAGGTRTDANGWYTLRLPIGEPFRLLAADATIHAGEYYDNTYNPESATLLQPASLSTTRVDFVLYTWTEDSDGDGLSDGEEDNVPDGIFNPAQDGSDRLLADTDGDGLNDGDERIAGTDPKDRESLLRFREMQRRGEQTVIRWDSVPGRNYAVLACDRLTAAPLWTNLTTVAADDWTAVLTNPAATTPRFFRIRVLP